MSDNTCPHCGQLIPGPVGRPVATTPPAAVSAALRLLAGGKTVTEAVAATGCNRRTLERWRVRTRQDGSL